MNDNDSDVSLAAVDAGIRRTIATYAQALDDGRADDIVALFCDDGVCEMPGYGTLSGHEAIGAAFGRWTPQRPQRHIVTNTAIAEWDDDEARATSDLVFHLQGRDGWRIELVGRYHDVFHRDGDRWLIHHRRAEFVPTPDDPSEET